MREVVAGEGQGGSQPARMHGGGLRMSAAFSYANAAEITGSATTGIGDKQSSCAQWPDRVNLNKGSRQSGCHLDVTLATQAGRPTR